MALKECTETNLYWSQCSNKHLFLSHSIRGLSLMKHIRLGNALTKKKKASTTIRHPQLHQAHLQQTHVSHNKNFNHTSLQQLQFWWGQGQQQKTSATSSPDDDSFYNFSGLLLMSSLEAKKCKQPKKNIWSSYREIFISSNRFAQWPLRTASSIATM